MRTPLNIFVLLLLALMATGCATTSPQHDPGFSASRPPAPLPPRENNGGIYQVNYGLALFQDTRARRVGDGESEMTEQRLIKLFATDIGVCVGSRCYFLQQIRMTPHRSLPENDHAAG